MLQGEDFSGDKAGLSLLEDVSAEGILAQLEEASVWLSQKSGEHPAGLCVLKMLQNAEAG